MTLMILGLALFLGAHSVRIFAEDWRTARVAAMGPNGWKAAYSVVSIAGFVLLIYGFGLARQAPVVLWTPPTWTKHVAALLTIPAFILLFAGKGPCGRIRQAVKHPMVLGVKTWAFAHLLANGKLAHVILFGSFLLWAILDFKAARGRDRAQGITYEAKGIGGDVVAVVVGLATWAAFAFYLHGEWIGVRPFGR